MLYMIHTTFIDDDCIQYEEITMHETCSRFDHRLSPPCFRSHCDSFLRRLHHYHQSHLFISFVLFAQLDSTHSPFQPLADIRIAKQRKDSSSQKTGSMRLEGEFSGCEV